MFAKDDKDHKGPGRHVIRYTTTKDFKTVAPSKDYVAGSQVPVLDQEVMKVGKNEYVRFLKSEKTWDVYQQISTHGLLAQESQWKTVGDRLRGVEGPALFQDNLDPKKYHLWVDKLGHTGYDAYETTDIHTGKWTPSTINVKDFRHGCVTPLTQKQYE